MYMCELGSRADTRAHLAASADLQCRHLPELSKLHILTTYACPSTSRPASIRSRSVS
jgi:hypothetical protein